MSKFQVGKTYWNDKNKQKYLCTRIDTVNVSGVELYLVFFSREDGTRSVDYQEEYSYLKEII